MRAIAITLALVLVSAVAMAQEPSANSSNQEITFTSSAKVAEMIAKAKSERKDGQPVVTQRLLQLPPYHASLEYRTAVGPAAIHEHEAEVFYVIDGSGTMVVGGKLVNETRTNPENLSGTAIDGGESRHVAKGDFLIVPENTAHWFSAIDGTLVLMSMHVPRPVPDSH